MHDRQTEEYRRFDERNTVFNRYDKRGAGPGTGPCANEAWERAQTHACDRVYKQLLSAWMPPEDLTTPLSAGLLPSDLTAKVKEVARHFGADLVEVASLNPLWVYSHNSSGRGLELPRGHERALVLVQRMDVSRLRLSPGEPANAETRLGYTRVAFITSLMTHFIRALGYGAIPCVNDTALSIPLAVAAGLGQLGRSGVLITREYGSAVRLSKILTTMPLQAPQEPDDILGSECYDCRQCALSCPVGAISLDAEPSHGITGPWNNPGIERWAVDAGRCYEFWRENGTSCSNCIAACPQSRKTT